MCTVLLPPGDNPIAVNKYIISHHSINYRHSSLEAIPATEISEIFSGRQPPQDVKVSRRFGY